MVPHEPMKLQTHSPTKDFPVKFCDTDGVTQSGLLNPVSAADFLKDMGAILLTDAIDPTHFSKMGERLVDLFGIDPGPRKKPETYKDIYDEERQLNLEKFTLVREMAGTCCFPLLCNFFKAERLILYERGIHYPRLQDPTRKDLGIPLHQDGGFLSFLMVRAWVLMFPETCGDTSPNIEMLVGEQEPIQPIETNPVSETYGWLEMSHEHRDALIQRRISWSPQVKQGDVLMFMGETPHRTNFPPSTENRRLSMEFSFFPFDEALLEHLTTGTEYGAFIITPDSFEYFPTKP